MSRAKDFFARMGERLDIPREALPGSFGLTLAGQNELVVRGCKRILAYTPSEVILAVGSTVLTVEGERLLCTAFGAGCVTLSGIVQKLRFGREAV